MHSKGNHKQTINKAQRQPSEWEKEFTNDATDKELISKIHKQLMDLSINKTKCKILKKKKAEDLNRHFSKKTHRWAINT